jgi:hypothetical protein
MAKQVATPETAIAVAVKVETLCSAERELATKDAGLYLSSKQVRRDLITAFVSAGRTSESWNKPEAGECAVFYNEMKAISRTACESGYSKSGLSTEELVTFPGGYLIATVIDPDVKPSQLPDWATEASRINGLTIRRYWQMQVDGWFKSTLKSMLDKEAKDALITGGAQALTKVKAQLTIDNLGSALKRDVDVVDGSDLVLGIKFAKDLRAQIQKIVNDNVGCKLPKFMVVDK